MGCAAGFRTTPQHQRPRRRLTLKEMTGIAVAAASRSRKVVKMSSTKKSNLSESCIVNIQTGKPLPPEAVPGPIYTDQNPAFLVDDGFDDILGPIDLKAAGEIERAQEAKARHELDERIATSRDRKNSIPEFSDADWAASGSRVRPPHAADLIGVDLKPGEALLVVVKRLPGGRSKRFRVAGPAHLVESALNEAKHPLFDPADHYSRMAAITDSGWRRL